MNLPSNKEETDRILFELLEGNLSKQEEEFWYDYSLKDNDFARQLSLFRKMYLKEDVNIYPDHSQLLKRSPWTGFWKHSFFIGTSALLIGIGAFYAFTSSTSTQEEVKQTLPVKVEQALPEKPLTPIVSPQMEEIKKTEPTTVQQIPRVVSQPSKVEKQKPTVQKEEPKAKEVLEQQPQKPAEEKVVMPTVARDSVKATKEVPLPVEEKKAIEKQETMAPSQAPKATEDKANKANGLKLKVKTSKKTKTTDFNF